MVPFGIKILHPAIFVPVILLQFRSRKMDGIMLKEMFLLVKESAEKGAQQALSAETSTCEKVTKTEAYRIYGRASVDRWLKEGLLKPEVPGGKKSLKSIDRKKLEAIAAGSNRNTYLPVAAR